MFPKRSFAGEHICLVFNTRIVFLLWCLFGNQGRNIRYMFFLTHPNLVTGMFFRHFKTDENSSLFWKTELFEKDECYVRRCVGFALDALFLEGLGKPKDF